MGLFHERDESFDCNSVMVDDAIKKSFRDGFPWPS